MKLADFGIARDVGGAQLTQAGMLRGKLAYAAPEQVERGHFDARTDLFSLGVSLWELSAGRRLFSGVDEQAVIKALLVDPIPSLATVAPNVPAQLVTIIEGLLERDPSKRTPSAQVLRQQLGSLPGELLDIRAGRARLASIVAVVERPKTDPTIATLRGADATAEIATPMSATR